MGKLYTPASRRDLLLAAYYSVLLKDSNFCRELEKLLDQLDQDLNPIISKLKEKRFGLTRAQRDLITFEFTLPETNDTILRAVINPVVLKSKLEPDSVFAACGSAALTLNSFIDTWKLPFDSKIDLLHYHYQARLKQANRATFERKIEKGLDSYGDWISITDFYYDPTQNTSEWLDEQITRISQEIKRRAREIENELKEKGLKPMATLWRPKREPIGGRISTVKSEFLSEALLKTARIYYLKEVYEYTWGQIAGKCKCSRSQAAGRHKNFVKALNQTIKEYLSRFSK